jgi:hypothetical protein
MRKPQPLAPRRRLGQSPDIDDIPEVVVVPIPVTQFHLFEWVVSLMMVGIGLSLAYPTPTAQGPFSAFITAVHINEIALTAFFLIIGGLRIGVLYMIGYAKRLGSRARAVCSMLGALIWTQMAAISAFEFAMTERVSTALPVYTCLALGEFVTFYRTSYDAGRSV